MLHKHLSSNAGDGERIDEKQFKREIEKIATGKELSWSSSKLSQKIKGKLANKCRLQWL